MLFGSGKTNTLLAPGPLTTHHAQIIRKDAWEQRCASCHPAGIDSPLAWIGHATGLRNIEDDTGDPITQSSLCLRCHESLTQPGAGPLFAHGLPVETLARSNKNQGSLFQSVSFADAAELEEEVACAACHQEHHGADFNLAHISNQRCQACHQEQYASFADGHPEFNSWPSTSSTGILFDHKSHQTEHFAKSNQKFDCRSCHLEDPQGDITQLASYQTSCASCHEGEIRNSLSKGVAIFSLPMIDDEALIEAGLSDSNWPQSARGDFDGPIPPMMKLLLAADDQAAAAMRHVGEDFSFFDIDATNTEDLKQAEILLQAIRSLAYDLQEEGHGAIHYRLRKILRASDLPDKEANYVSSLPIELIDEMQASWFDEEGVTKSQTFEEAEERTTGGGWQLDSDGYQLLYFGTEHGDPMIKAWLDVIATLPKERHALRDALLKEMQLPNASGKCLSCHEVQPTGNDQLTIRWHGRERSAESKGFTKFSHRPHLTQPGLADCTHCHRQADGVSILLSLNDHHDKQSDFAAIKKQACIDCHHAKAAGDQCSLCHNYHVDPRSLKTHTLKTHNRLASEP